MADLNNFAVTPGAAANLNVPTQVITGQLTEGQDVLADFTAGNAIRFPAVLATITAEQYAEIMDMVANRIIFMKAGL